MWYEFMQMGAPAAAAIIGMGAGAAGIFAVARVSANKRRKDEHEYDLSMVALADKAKMIEPPRANG